MGIAAAAEAAGGKVLLEAIGCHGEITAALESSLSVEEADRMLSELAVRGHLDVSLEHGRLVYAVMGERDAPYRELALWRDPELMVWPSPKSTIRDGGDGQHAQPSWGL